MTQRIPHLAPEFVNGDVSFWYRDSGLPARRAALAGDLRADVAIVGGGLTGLWTAYYVRQARPDWDVVVIEKEFAGFGASGRNGGWMSAEPAGQFRRYAADRGIDAAMALQREMFHAVDEAVDVATREGFGEGVVKEGLLHVATSRAQLARLRSHVEEMRTQGWGQDDVSLLTPDELARHVRIAGALGGYFTPHCARVQPAMFTRGLAEAVERAGATIYEGTPAVAIRPGAVDTPHGTVSAPRIVQALEGYTGSLPGQRRALLPMNSSMIVTEPLPTHVLEDIGWRGAPLVGDVAHSFTYMQRTADDRIAIGGRGVPYDFASSFDPRGHTADDAVEQLRTRLVELFPALVDVRVEHSWSGVLGVPRDWCAAVTFDRNAGLIRAGGYTGHGLTGTNLAARTVRDLLLGDRTPLVDLPWVDRHARNWEPEPLRWIGATALYAAYRAADRAEYAKATPRTHLAARIANAVSGR